MKILRNNLNIDISEDLQKASEFLSINGYKETFECIDTNYTLPDLTVNGTDGNQKQYVIKMRETIKPTEPTMFIFEPIGNVTDGYITSTTEAWDFATIRTGFELWKSITHEYMHMKFKEASKNGFTLYDPMDFMLVKEGGVWVGKTYYKNNDPYAKDGNYAEAFKRLRSIVLKQGSKGEPVKQLQRDLKALGYFKYPFITGTFGPVTKTAVQALQRATGLVVDGVAGAKTLAKIEELKKKPNFGLDPKVEALAYLLIAKCKQLYGYNIRITEGYRTQERQNELYASGRTKVGQILTNAKKSKHTSKLAFDVAFVGKEPYPKDNGQYKKIADIAKSIGLKPGYYFKKFRDAVHFEL